MYRPEVDGLRAIAVVPVVLYHAGVSVTPGGYVGVDVFFVISGYLITSILLREIRGPGLSIIDFYDRRIRRLLPALFAVLVFTTILAYLLLPPTELRDYAQSLGATTLFGSNVLFFVESGYFDAASETKPLLHTWSLAVEEQFYLVYPFLLAGLVKWFPVRLVLILSGLVLLSFAANVLVVEVDQSAAFYLIPFRAWELGLGAILAIAPPVWRAGSAVPELLRWSGIGLILLSVLAFSAETTFPGWPALMPCVGAAMIIAAGSNSSGGAFGVLSARPLVFVGQISYSLYLWHWPIIVFLSLASPTGKLSARSAIFAVVVSLIAAVLSWRYIEHPFRARGVLKGRRSLFIATTVVSFAWLGMASIGHLSNGLPQRLSPEALAFVTAAEDFSPRPPECRPIEGMEYFCKIGAPEVDPSFVFWGDSHAAILSNGVHASAIRTGVSGLYSGMAGCPPFFDVVKDERSADAFADAACTHRNAELKMVLLEHAEGIDKVVMAGRWSYYAQGQGLGIDSHNRIAIRHIDDPPGSNDEVFSALFSKTINDLVSLGLSVAILEQVPEFPNYSSSNVVRELMIGEVDWIGREESPLHVTVEDVERRQEVFQTLVSSGNLPPNAKVVRTRQLFCDRDRCSVVKDGRPAYFDNNHVTTTTAVKLGRLLDSVFSNTEVTDR